VFLLPCLSTLVPGAASRRDSAGEFDAVAVAVALCLEPSGCVHLEKVDSILLANGGPIRHQSQGEQQQSV
jgi:hypothetical protein